MGEPTRDQQVQRLLCAIEPTRLERASTLAARLVWKVSERGPFGWLGDRLDDVRVASIRRRADRRLVEHDARGGS